MFKCEECVIGECSCRVWEERGKEEKGVKRKEEKTRGEIRREGRKGKNGNGED